MGNIVSLISIYTEYAAEAWEECRGGVQPNPVIAMIGFGTRYLLKKWAVKTRYGTQKQGKKHLKVYQDANPAHIIIAGPNYQGAID
jgi:hypothetical protein